MKTKLENLQQRSHTIALNKGTNFVKKANFSEKMLASAKLTNSWD